MTAGSQSPNRNLKIRDRLFPKADSFVFDNSTGGFISLPILLRKVLRHLKPTQLELLIYLWLRTDRYGLCYPTLDEIAYELGQQNTSRLRKTIGDLERGGFISSRNEKGRMYFLVHDPRHALTRMSEKGMLQTHDMDEINELLEKLKLPRIPPSARKAKSPGS